MAFEPDIIVTGPEGLEIALVVAVKTDLRGLETSEQQLKKFMASMGSPVGILVTPERLRLYRDQYLSSLENSGENSITKVSEFDVRSVFDSAQAGNKVAFERLVQSWLEGLSTESGLRELPPELRVAAQRYIVPAISQGAIRAGHPR
jgi:hypothetical protein